MSEIVLEVGKILILNSNKTILPLCAKRNQVINRDLNVDTASMLACMSGIVIVLKTDALDAVWLLETWWRGLLLLARVFLFCCRLLNQILYGRHFYFHLLVLKGISVKDLETQKGCWKGLSGGWILPSGSDLRLTWPAFGHGQSAVFGHGLLGHDTNTADSRRRPVRVWVMKNLSYLTI